MSGFLGLQIALSGLRAQQAAMDVTAHNIANAGTEGYRRQEAVMVPGISLESGALGAPRLGTGVVVDRVRRMQTDYVEEQVRMAHRWLGDWSSRSEALSQVESLIGEPGPLGLASALDAFWNSWEELSASPESVAARAAVVESGAGLAERIRSLYGGLRSIQSRTDREIVDGADQINRIAAEIASLNRQMQGFEEGQYEPNDLMDKRDMLLDELSKLVQIQVNGSGPEMIVTIAGKVLVQGERVSEVGVVEGANGWSRLVWAADGTDVEIRDGELAGKLEVRDVLIEDYIGSLDDIAEALVGEVNAVYSTGVGPGGGAAGNFFVAGTNAANIAVEAGLVSSPSGLIASATGAAGDNSIARAISDLRDNGAVGGQTIGEYYAELVARIGSNSREAAKHVETYDLTLRQLDVQRESTSGVSLDEEMLNMVRFQQAYNAAARVATVIDEMIETVVSRLGVGGR